MKILFLSHYFPPEGNAPATRVYEFARRWVAAGHEVTVLTCAPNVPSGVVYDGYGNRIYQRETMEGIEVIRLWTYVAPNKGFARRILNYVSFLNSAFWVGLFRKTPDVMIATSPQMFCGVAGALLSLFKRCPFVLEIRDIWPESITAVGAMRKGVTIRVLEKLERWMYRRAKQIVAVGPGYKRKLVERGVPSSKIAVITNGVDTRAYTPRPPDEKFRREHGLDGKFAIGYVGTVGMAAGLDVVVHAAAKLESESNDQIVFVIVGDGADRKRLEDMVRQRALKTVRFLGRLPKNEMPRVLASLDACLIHLRKTALFEAVLPSKIFEAAAMARPIILGVGGDAAALIHAAGGGLCMDPGNSAALVELAKRLAESPTWPRALGKKGRTFMSGHYDLDALARDYSQSLATLVKKSPRQLKSPLCPTPDYCALPPKVAPRTAPPEREVG